ncbi:hypothetical protein [Streptomyces sp. NPDC045369]|uniref:hypothetical protein n=1 Tax=Streptomyces sp. NPDC045369 TaxID=3155732 RepID=UPI0033D645AC
MSFFAPSAPSNYIKFVNPGDSAAGFIEEVSDPFPVKEFKKDTVKVDAKGEPVMQVRMILATDQSGPNDDGRRSLYVSGWRMTTAIGDAMRRAGETAEAPQVGAFLKLTFARLGQAQGGMAPPKVYVAEYTKPADANARRPQGTQDSAAVNESSWGQPASAPW